ncbi:hypothetical protein [Kribbella sp. NPDC000426]|uniref:hypothetical protein n=1 Tax=Kribbella sp. NPDC000426 TaxID=3154255 RepID=UPI00331FDCCE
MDFFAARGRFDLLPNHVAYRTPEFERAMLLASGLPVADWRRGDVLDARIDRIVQPELIDFDARDLSDWKPFNIGGRVVRLRLASDVTDGPVEFSPPPGAKGWVILNPSRSALRDARVNCVTSSGVALRIRSGARMLADSLGDLEAGVALEDVIRRLDAGVTHTGRLEELLLQLVGDNQKREAR